MSVGIVILVLHILLSVSSQSSADEWYRLDDALYLVDDTTQLNFDEAQSYCRTQGANLARIDSDKIQSFLTTFMSPPLTTSRCFWIGCNDRQVEGQYKWIDGTQVRYDGWAQGQPSDGGPGQTQDCACLSSNTNSNRHGRWDDNYCRALLNFICEKVSFLPRLTSGPSVEDIGSTFVTISWSSWNPSRDTGDGPVVSYLVYLQTMDGEWKEGGGIASDGQQRMEFVLTGLEPGTEYKISVSAVIEGMGGVGAKGPFVSVTTIAVPGLTSAPSVEDISSTFVTVSWSSWIPCLDTGEGPVVSYLVYLQTMGGEWIEGGGIDSDVGEGDLQRRMEFVLTGLEPETEYNISVSAVREGVDGEGPKGPFVYVTTTSIALPGLTSAPSVEDISSTFVTFSWRSWIPCLDTGDGPVVSYLVYLQTMGGEWIEGGGIDSDVGEGNLQRRMEFVLTGLEPGTEYNISVSAVREGIGGEGPKGPLVSVTTTSIESSGRFGALGKGNLIWILFWVSLAGNIVLVVVIVITCWRYRKQQKTDTNVNNVSIHNSYRVDYVNTIT